MAFENPPLVDDFTIQIAIFSGIFHCHVWLAEGNHVLKIVIL
jgi:hypothetical protein